VSLTSSFAFVTFAFASSLALLYPDCYLDSILLRFLSSNYRDYFPFNS